MRYIASQLPGVIQQTVFQVSPELYGDSCPRFFTYWTVSTT